jgi:uncharacterized membrane protein
VFELLFTHPLWAYRAGKLTLASGWPQWLLVALIVGACAAIAVGLWQRRFLGWPRVAAIGVLQAALAALVLCLLWRPVLNVERVRDRQNVLAIVLDNSASMMQVDGIDDQPTSQRGAQKVERGAEVAEGVSPTRLQQAITALEAGPLAELGKTFELRYFAFGNADGKTGSSVVPIDSINALPAAGPQTRIGDALVNVMQTAGSVPLAGVMLISDGAENGRSLGEAQLGEIASYGVPVHTIGVGPERIVNDLELADVDLPASIAPGATVTTDVTIKHSGAATTRLRIYDNDTLLAARELKLTAGATPDGANTTTVRVEFPAGAAGVRDLRLTLDPLAGERNVVNNSRRRVVNVPAVRRSILYVEGEPRWEFKFLRRAIEGERSLRVASIVRTTENKFYRQGVTSGDELGEGLPETPEALFAYDAIILGSYEAASLSLAQHQLLKDFVDRRGGGLLMLAGNGGLADGGWGSSALAQVLPVHLPTKRGKDFVQTPTKAHLTRYGAESTIVRFDADPVRNTEMWQTLPDLANYHRVGALRPGAVTLIDGVIKTANKEERVPLLVWQRYGSGSAYVLATGSTQRWQMSLPVDDLRHEMFWRQLLHAIADRTPQRAWLGSDRVAYEDERGVTLEAEVRDEKFMPIATATVATNAAGSRPAAPSAPTDARPKIELMITPENGEPIIQEMLPSPTSPGRYTASFDAATPGLYRAELAARFGKDKVVTTSSAFRRDDNVVEHFDTGQHRAVLERLSNDTQGRYWQLDGLPEISRAIPYTKSGIVERQVLDLWNLPIVFLMLLALKLGEWLLRLRWGTL